MMLFEIVFEKTDKCPEGVEFTQPFWVVAPTKALAEAAAGDSLGWVTMKVTELGLVHKVVTCNG